MPPTAQGVELVEHFVNMFPNLDPGFVSDVSLSDELGGDKAKIRSYLLGMGGVSADGAGFNVSSEDQEDVDEVQNFIMNCNERQAELISGLQHPDDFNEELLNLVEDDIKSAMELLKNSKLHPVSRSGLETLVREAKDVLSCATAESVTPLIDGGRPMTDEERQQLRTRTGADPEEVKRLREQLQREQRRVQELTKQADQTLKERDQARAAKSSAEQQLAKFTKTSGSTAQQQQQLTKALEENSKLRSSLTSFIAHTRRMSQRMRENATDAKQTLEDEKARMAGDFTSCIATIGKLKQNEMLEKLYHKMERMYKEEVALRKQYYNTIQELRGNIRVFARVRPLIGLEVQKGDTETCCNFDKNDVDVVTVKDTKGSKKFTFNKVFGPTCTQAEIFQDTLPLIDSVVDGYNVCIFAYGQTGSGKSYTMDGPTQEEIPDKKEWLKTRGVNRRAVDRMYDIIRERSEMEQITVYLSVLEIYCEKVRDLLAPQKKNTDYKVRTGLHPVGEFEVPGNYVENLTQVLVGGADAVATHMAQALKNRREGTTDMNAHSSRSHMILSLVVCSKNIGTGAQSFGKLNLIDLAGSERLSKTGATGQTAEEAKNINLSLSSLGKVISDLQNGAKHVNYRDSNLTHLLQDSLSGSSKVLMFANCSPASSNSSETKNTLEMASRAMKCSLGKAGKNKVK
ncbi:Kinesin-like protein klp-3 [Diplonema papillatum]|nr:Kinesin-like protein klp-3 [Diplonema papillatum]